MICNKCKKGGRIYARGLCYKCYTTSRLPRYIPMIGRPLRTSEIENNIMVMYNKLKFWKKKRNHLSSLQ